MTEGVQPEKKEWNIQFDETPEVKRRHDLDEYGKGHVVEPPDVVFIERMSRTALIEQCSAINAETKNKEVNQNRRANQRRKSKNKRRNGVVRRDHRKYKKHETV